MSDSINNTVTFLEIIQVEGMTPKSAIMAPKALFQKIWAGQDISNDEMLQCVIVKDFE